MFKMLYCKLYISLLTRTFIRVHAIKTYCVIGDNRPQSRNPDNYYPVKARTETFKNSFIPSTVALWNSLNASNRNLSYCKSIMKTMKSHLLYYGNRVSNIKHAQLRMQCSKLNYHLFLLHVRASFECPCGHNCEDTNHFLLHCPLYFQARTEMIDKIRSLGLDVTCDLLLHGAENVDMSVNFKMFDAVHVYIESTERL